MYTIITLPTTSTLSDGIASTLAAMSVKEPGILETKMWLPNKKPIFDMLEESRPSYVIADCDAVPDMTKALKEFPDTKLILLGNTPCSHAELIPDFWGVSPGISKIILKNSAAKKTVEIEPAAALALYNRGEKIDSYGVDLVYIANSLNILDGELDMLSIMSSLAHSFRIIGYHRPFLQYVGQANTVEMSNYLASAKIVIDTNKRTLYDAGAQEGFALSTVENKYYPCLLKDGELDTDYIISTTKEWLDRDISRKKMGKAIKKKVLESDTYFHRVSDIFSSMGDDNLAKSALSTLETLLKDMQNV
tara:strand:- start:3625 stop:4539 length:915 start_codon:yes stop_codon:yes gene_type:complete